MYIIIIIIKSVSVLVSLFDTNSWVWGAGGGRCSALRLLIAHRTSALILPLDELFVVSPKHIKVMDSSQDQCPDTATG